MEQSCSSCKTSAYVPCLTHHLRRLHADASCHRYRSASAVAKAFHMKCCLHAPRKLMVSVPLTPLAATAALISNVLRCTSAVQSQAGSNVLYERDMGRPVLERAQGNIISSKPFISHSTEASTQRGLLAHELIQGPLVRPYGLHDDRPTVMCLTCCNLVVRADAPYKYIHRKCKLNKSQVQQKLLIGELVQQIEMQIAASRTGNLMS